MNALDQTARAASIDPATSVGIVALTVADLDLTQYERWLALHDQINRRCSGGADAHFSQAIAAGYAALIGKQVV